MNGNNKALLDGLNKTQYASFLKNAIGLKAFFRKETFVKLRVKKGQKKAGVKFLGKLKEEEIVLSVDIGDFENKTFHDSRGSIHNVADYLDGLDEPLLQCLLLTAKGIDRIENASLDKAFSGDTKELFLNNLPKEYSFIVGAGVNLDHGLSISIGNWESLIQSMRSVVRTMKSIVVAPPPCGPQRAACRYEERDDLTDFEVSICNTNYIAPQVLKTLDELRYYQELHRSLYSSYKPENLNVKNNPSVTSTSLYQIARILERQGSGKVLTFNYDNVLEEIFSNFTPLWQSIYSGVTPKVGKSVFIIHSHGFFPYMAKKPNGLVLSTYEYLEGYSRNHYPKKMLTEQLNNTNILVGNSLADYEEQKVFFNHHEEIPSSWHYLFAKKSTSPWMDNYKTCYFMNMGVIPVFFDDFPYIVDFLKKL